MVSSITKKNLNPVSALLKIRVIFFFTFLAPKYKKVENAQTNTNAHAYNEYALGYYLRAQYQILHSLYEKINK